MRACCPANILVSQSIIKRPTKRTLPRTKARILKNHHWIPANTPCQLPGALASFLRSSTALPCSVRPPRVLHGVRSSFDESRGQQTSETLISPCSILSPTDAGPSSHSGFTHSREPAVSLRSVIMSNRPASDPHAATLPSLVSLWMEKRPACGTVQLRGFQSQ
jgi:hypothetical protein